MLSSNVVVTRECSNTPSSTMFSSAWYFIYRYGTRFDFWYERRLCSSIRYDMSACQHHRIGEAVKPLVLQRFYRSSRF